MTGLTKAVTRRTRKIYHGKPVIVTLAPASSTSDALIGLRLLASDAPKSQLQPKEER